MENLLINYDTYYSDKNIDGNSYKTIFKMDNLINVKKIYLKSVEIPINLNNIRNPYNVFYYSITKLNITTYYNFTIPEKVYTNIYTLILDLNALIVLNIQPKLDTTTEIAPIIALSSDYLNKVYMYYTTVNTTITIINDGILKYYLGYSDMTQKSYSSVLTTIKTLYIFQNCYNLNFDSYYNLSITNIATISKNTNISCDFKLAIDSIQNSIFYYNNKNSYAQYISINNRDTVINKLCILLSDKYNNVIYSNIDWSFTLEYEFY